MRRSEGSPVQEQVGEDEVPARLHQPSDVGDRLREAPVVDDMEQYVERRYHVEWSLSAHEVRVADIALLKADARERALEVDHCFEGQIGANHAADAESLPQIDVHAGARPDVEHLQRGSLFGSEHSAHPHYELCTTDDV